MQCLRISASLANTEHVLDVCGAFPLWFAPVDQPLWKLNGDVGTPTPSYLLPFGKVSHRQFTHLMNQEQNILFPVFSVELTLD